MHPLIVALLVTKSRIAVPAGVHSIATDGMTVVILTEDRKLVGVSRRGTRLYEVETTGTPGKVDAADGVALLWTDASGVTAVDATTGATKWSRTFTGETVDANVANGQLQVDGDHVLTVDLATGKDVTRKPVIATKPPTIVEKHEKKLVGTDGATAKQRWSVRIPAIDYPRAVFAGNKLTWVVMIDGAVMQKGDAADYLVAVTDGGVMTKELTLPSLCSVPSEVVGAGGTIAVAHEIRGTKDCATVVDIFTPS